jgi:hypothetical protein
MLLKVVWTLESPPQKKTLANSYISSFNLLILNFNFNNNLRDLDASTYETRILKNRYSGRRDKPRPNPVGIHPWEKMNIKNLLITINKESLIKNTSAWIIFVPSPIAIENFLKNNKLFVGGLFFVRFVFCNWNRPFGNFHEEGKL